MAADTTDNSPAAIGHPGAATHRYPDFLCIGVQKAGTTWIYENLRRHPKIWMPPVKELQYFNELYIPSHAKWTGGHRRGHGSRMLKNYLTRVPQEKWNYQYIARCADIVDGVPSDEWYGNIFMLAGSDQVCGEITPEYSLLPAIGIRHILRLAPDVKIVVSLRDPIDRIWSHLRMLTRNASDTSATNLIRIAGYPDVSERANYPRILHEWSGLVAANRLLVLFLDDIISRPREVMINICGHLAVAFDDTHFPNLQNKVHVGEEMEIPAEVYEFLRERMRPVYEQLVVDFPEICGPWFDRHYEGKVPAGLS
jgi:hypothetical protein